MVLWPTVLCASRMHDDTLIYLQDSTNPTNLFVLSPETPKLLQKSKQYFVENFHVMQPPPTSSEPSSSTVHKSHTPEFSTQTIHCRETQTIHHSICNSVSTVQTTKSKKGTRDQETLTSAFRVGLFSLMLSSSRPSHIHATRNQILIAIVCFFICLAPILLYLLFH
jgi:hypothetical protein